MSRASDDTKTLFVIIVVLIGVALVASIWCEYEKREEAKTFYPSSRVLVTTAKISEMDGYTRVYTDDDSDYAVFVKKSYSSNQLPVNTKVTIGVSTGVVTETHDSYFVVRANAPQSLPGSVVYADDTAVGFVSGCENNDVTCTYY